ncbi:ABC transporter substrate-binding protein [Amorphoplanes nipponensis]|uniref:ABC transporter substrate-binding protein n=1 Tax=Actinoplanes nipponensis TaxID=135950 RepID=A0A919JE42_9ACTN|nr:ABC transporter substrate-binding protein [Actinoplanes nipponensis]GIE47292.1 ABC transporter substrate-binding protein [Actinoplanes nipponensis]
MSVPPGMSRRAILGLTASALAATALTACGGDSGGSSAGSGQGTLTIGFDNEPVSLDPALSSAISSDRNLLNLFYEGLVRQEKDGTIVPALAESWKVDGSALTFTLRTGVTFHDGSPFDADAAAWNLKRVIDPATRSTKAGTLSTIASVTVLDPRTVRIQTKSPDPLLLTQLSYEPGMMVSRKAASAAGKDFGRGPVGTGPFVLERWIAKSQLVAKRNPGYWRKDAAGQALPRLDKVVVRFITEPKTLRAELSTGGVQLLRALPPEEYTQLKDNAQVRLEDLGVRRSYYLAVNSTRAPFDKLAPRRALAGAIDRDGVGQTAASGEYDLTATFATKADWFADPTLPVPAFDAAKAGAAFAAAGVGAGTPLKLVVRNRPPDPTIAQLIQANLRAAGLEVTIEALQLESYLDTLKKGDFDLGLGVIDVPRYDPSLTFDPYLSSTGPNNFSKIKDPELDKVLAAGRAAPDRKVRTEAYTDVQRRVLDQSHLVFLHQARSPVIHRSDLSGLAFDLDGQWRLHEARLGR